MDPFDYAFDQTLGLEGGYSNAPGDRGGETKYGITAAVFARALERGIISGTETVRDLTIAQAKAIYRTDYWLPLKLHEVRNRQIAAEIFDTAVNMGPGTAAILAQTALNYLGEQVAIDGAIGPVTLGLINKWCAKDPRALMVCLNGFQFLGYCALVDGALIDRIQARFRGSADQKQFARGWTKRIQAYREEDKSWTGKT